MSFPLYLALRNLLRHPGRNLLYVLGISITAALLLDMILLSGGLKVSLRRVLKELGWEIRISPRGTLPFETDAQIYHYNDLRRQMLQLVQAESLDALLGASLSAQFGGQTFTTFAAGTDLGAHRLYRMLEGREPKWGEVLINQYLTREWKIKTGDRLVISSRTRLQSIGSEESFTVTVSGVATFVMDAEGQFTMACPLPFLQKVISAHDDPVSMMMIRLKNPADANRIADILNQRFPQISAYTVEKVVQAVDQQLSYFKQFSYILGGISLVVTFVLIFIITTISFHDRLGEIALLRAIGLRHRTIFLTILMEGVLVSVAAALFGFLLGKLVSLYLDAVLKSAPGLPVDFSFFVFEWGSVLKAFLTLILTGFFAGFYPAAAAVRLPIAETMREEIL